MDEHFGTSVRPFAQPRSEGRSGSDRRFAPVIGHDQQRQPVRRRMPPEVIAKPVDRAF
jgi:hypothetical protein